MEEKGREQLEGLHYGVAMDLLLAADCGGDALVRKILASGEDVNKVFNHPKFNGRATALHYACRSGHLNVVRTLVEDFGAALDVVEVEEWTPLYYAAYNGHFDIAKLLLEKGADQHIKDNYQSRTALDVAKYRQFSDVVGLLLSQGKSAEEAEALLNDKRYIRSDKEIEAEGRKRKVMSGIHWANVHLFLGRYKISKEDVKKLETFRQSSREPDVIVNAEDTVLGIPVVLRHTHDRDKHHQETRELIHNGTRFLRSSALGTNEHLLVLVSSPKDEKS